MTYQGEIFAVGLELVLNVRNKWRRTLFIKFYHLALHMVVSVDLIIFTVIPVLYQTLLALGATKDLTANSHVFQVSLWENY